MTCRCHEKTIKNCPEHGTPIQGLKPGERIISAHDMVMLGLARDPERAAILAAEERQRAKQASR